MVLLLGLVSYKLQHIGLLYFGDEAWPYGVAVRTLHHNGLSLLPHALPPDLSRGHPLLFHFLAAMWMRIFGTSPVAGHTFALTISVLLILEVYFFCKAFFSERVGFLACFILCVQVGFVAQSAFLLPEVLFALFTLLAFHAFFREKKIMFVLLATCMLLTKESGVVMIFALLAWRIATFLLQAKKDRKALMSGLLMMVTPLLIASAYFFIQKIEYGWFFFPLHIGLIVIDKSVITDNLPKAMAYLTINDGRNMLSLFIVIALIVSLLKRNRLSANEKKIFSCFCCYLVSFLVFTSMNFYMTRYMLCLLPPFIIMGTVVIDRAFSKVRFLYMGAIIVITCAALLPFISKKNVQDLNCAYSVRTDHRMVAYCEQKNLYDTCIFTTSVLCYDFTDPYTGYLSGSKRFTNVGLQFSGKTAYCIFSTDQYDPDLFERIKKENKLVLIQRYEQGYAWCELYKVQR